MSAAAKQTQPEASLWPEASIHRQRFVAELGRHALAGCPLDQLLGRTCRELVSLLDTPLVKVLELTPGERDLRVVAGVGWQLGVVGEAVVAVDRGSQAGYTLEVDTAVVVTDFATETRFAPPPLLVSHGVVSGMSVPIHARDRVFGVLGVHARAAQRFSDDDTHFLTSVANVLGAAIASFEAREALHRSTQLFRTVFEDSSDAILLLDERAMLRAANPAAYSLLGYTPGEVDGRNVFELIHLDDQRNAMLALSQLLGRDLGPRMLELRVRARDGSWLTLEAFGRRARASDGVPLIVINARDVTERLRLEERRRQSQKLETVGLVATGVAHDLNNVLQSIGLNASLLETALAGTELVTETQDIAQAVAQATRFLRGLMAFARDQPSKPVPLELNEVIRDLQPLLRRLVPDRIDLGVLLTSMPTPIRADRAELEQILINLVVNARDAMPDDGPISIATWATPQHVVLSVADRGVGMDDATRARIFDPFFSTKGDRGTGLGLSIVRRLAERHGVIIDVASVVGTGTSFELSFPRHAH